VCRRGDPTSERDHFGTGADRHLDCNTAAMDVTAALDAPCAPEVLFRHVDELTDYPRWMAMVHHVEQAEPADGRPAWLVELRARVGPLARSKRLRMVRSLHDPAAGRVRFERIETTRRTHSPWVLDAQVSATTAGSRLEMHLHYGGSLWTAGVMERVLGDQIESGRDRLLALLTIDSA
jgi:hypothetical protein